MPSLGTLGAIGGAAKGFNDYLTQELQFARQQKLEELRTRNQRETNRIDAEMRGGMATERDKTRHDFSLKELQERNKLAIERDEASRTAGYGENQTDLERRITFLTRPIEEKGMGLTREEALNIVSPRAGGPMAIQDFKADMYKRLANTGILKPEEINASIEEGIKYVYGPQQSAGQQQGVSRETSEKNFGDAMKLLRSDPEKYAPEFESEFRARMA
jgi:hypothetical protein